MFDTWYEIKAKMPNKDGYEDYKDSAGENKLYSICECKGRPPHGGPYCVRNPNKDLAHRGQGWCIWFLPNGSSHCGHRFPPKEEEPKI